MSALLGTFLAREKYPRVWGWKPHDLPGAGGPRPFPGPGTGPALLSRKAKPCHRVR